MGDDDEDDDDGGGDDDGDDDDDEDDDDDDDDVVYAYSLQLDTSRSTSVRNSRMVMYTWLFTCTKRQNCMSVHPHFLWAGMRVCGKFWDLGAHVKEADRLHDSLPVIFFSLGVGKILC